MAKEITVPAEPRASRGKNEARRLRQRGMIPAVIYGAYRDAVAVAVSPKEIQRILHSRSGHNTIFNVGLGESETTPVMIVDWQYDPMKDTLLHVDLKRIDLSKRIKVSVPVQTTGDAKGVKAQGGLLEVVTREVEVECLPNDIPEHFTMDVTELIIGQSVRAGDVPMSGTMRLLTPPDTVVVHVVALRGIAEPTAAGTTPEVAPAPGEAEPEVIKKGRKEEEAAEEKKKK